MKLVSNKGTQMPSVVKNPSKQEMQEMQVLSLGLEGPWKEMVIHSVSLSEKSREQEVHICSPQGHKEPRCDLATKLAACSPVNTDLWL